jgi:type I restriction enzyme S subunit
MPDSVPSTWRTALLGDAVTFSRGIDLPVQSRTEGRYPVIGSNGVVGFHSEVAAHAPGVLVGRSGSVGEVTYIEDDYWPLNTTLWVTDFHGNDPLFVSFFLRNLDLGRFAAGVSVPTLNRNILHRIQVQLPAVAEQRAIALVLRTVQKTIEARQRELALEREHRAALREHLFTHGTRGEQTKQTEIGEIPESWQLVEAGAVADIGNGSTPSRKDERYWNGGTIPWITSTKVHEVVIRGADEFVTETARTECHLPLVPRHSIVVAITGQGKTLGNSAILELDTCINQHLAYVHFTDKTIRPLFALSYLRSRYDYFRNVSAGGGSTKGALTCGFLKRLKIPVPLSDEQDAIAQVLSACEDKCGCLGNEVGLLDEFFTAALGELMGGRLDVNKLTDGGTVS